MTVNLSALGGAGQQFFDNNGNVLTGGKLWSYQAGTTTPQATYTSASGATAHTNPIVLDSAGRVATGEIWVTAGQNYKFVLMTSTNVTIATWDNITGINGTGIPSNANNVEYDPPLTGALTSGYTVENKLAQTVSVMDFGAVGDGVTDDTVAIQNALDSVANGGGLFIPAGTYRITQKIVLSISTNTSVSIFGEGSKSVISSSGFNTEAFEIRPNDDWANCVTSIENFHITAPSIVSNSIGLLCSDINGTSGLSIEKVAVKGFDVGFKFTANQFCSYRELMASGCNVGLHHSQSVIQGGGNNNTYYDCKFSYNVVGVFIDAPSPYPCHDNQFINLVTHVNSVCAFFATDARLISISNWAPEANGSGASTYTYEGQVIKNSILHITDNSSVALVEYQHTSLTQFIYAYVNSIIYINGGAGGKTLWDTDTSSCVSFGSSPYYMYGGSGSSILGEAPFFIGGGIASVFLTTPTITDAKWLQNDAVDVYGSNVDIGGYSGGTFSGATYVTDPTLGYVLQFSYSGSGSGSQSVISGKTSSFTGVGTTILFSALLKSSSSTASWNFNYAQSTAVSDVTIPADTWVRIVIFGTLTGTPRNQFLIITPDASAIGETLSVCKIHTMTSPDARTLASFVRSGLYNNGQKTDEYRLSAAPTIGTWKVGEIVYNTAPVAGGTTGWICTTAGTPGTWKTFGAIAP